MNAIRATQTLNRRELEQATPPSASWHVDYRDTAWVYVGGLPLDLSEGDVVTIFSQYGNPTHLNLIRDKETGKSKGFGFLKYEDQRSCDLAVDNLGGAEVLGRLLRVDHTRYKKRDGEEEDTYLIERLEAEAEREQRVNENGKRASDTEDSGNERKKRLKKTSRDRPLLKEERELEDLLQIEDGEEQDPMREYLIREKREEVERARQREKEKGHRHHHRHHHQRQPAADLDANGERKHRHPHRRTSEDADGGREHKRRSHRERDEDVDRNRARRRQSTKEGEDGTRGEGHRAIEDRPSTKDRRRERRDHSRDEDEEPASRRRRRHRRDSPLDDQDYRGSRRKHRSQSPEESRPYDYRDQDRDQDRESRSRRHRDRKDDDTE